MIYTEWGDINEISHKNSQVDVIAVAVAVSVSAA